VVTVTAARDIRTDAGFTIARAGARGTLLEGAEPTLPCNFGKVLIRFDGRQRGYWVAPDVLRNGHGLAQYVSQKPKPRRAPGPPRRGFAYEYDFGANLRIVRKARGVTQAELAALMERNGHVAAQSTICFREREAASPCSEFVNAAARALEVPPFVLFLPFMDCGVYPQIREFLCSTSSACCAGADE